MALPFSELPLLRRELTELANRRRTYIVRVIGAAVILLGVFIIFMQVVSTWDASNSGGFGRKTYLGMGNDVFARVVPLLFIAVDILMPALCCASITMEKEQNTIGTLFLTRLSPWTIIFEKLGSRMVPMLTILLLASPVLAFVYSLGGVDTRILYATIWLLFCECILFGSIALMCSSWFPTTVGAFIWSYLLIGIITMFSLGLGMQTFVPSMLWSMSQQEFPLSQSLADSPLLFMIAIVAFSVPSLFVSGFCLLLARAFLVPRAFVSSSSLLLKAFKVFDSFFSDLNDRTTGGIVLIRDSSPLPENDPVAWRERNKKSLGKARYLFRILIAIEGPTLFICAATATTSARNAFSGLYFLQYLIWALVVMMACVKGSTLFSSERARETIEALLATPMSATEMLRQKIVGMRRLIIVLAVPVLTINLTHCLLHTSLRSISLSEVFYISIYGVFSIVVTFVLLYLATLVSAGIGLWIHGQTKAVVTSIVFVGLWTFVPFLLMTIMQLSAGRGFAQSGQLVLLLSPVSPAVQNETFLLNQTAGYDSYYNQGNPAVSPSYSLILLCVSTLIYTGLLAGLWQILKSCAPQLLNRRESPRQPRVDVVTPQSSLSMAEG